MSFRISPVEICNTLHSLVEQSETRISFGEAVHLLASKGLVLPGKTEKEQTKVLSSLINLCSPSYLDVRRGRSGGVGLPSKHEAKRSAMRANKSRGLQPEVETD